jgi:hypothetical protein
MTTGLERTRPERTHFESTRLERAQVLRFPIGADTRPARPRRRSLRDVLAVARARRAARRASHVAVATERPPRAAAPTRRARDVHDAAIARGIAPPF